MAEGTANRPATGATSGAGGDRGKYVDYREFVDYQLERVRSLVRSTEITTALTRMGALLAGYLLLFLVLDQWVWPGGVPLTARWVAQAALLCSLGWLGWRHVLIPSLSRVNPLFAARELERAQPGLQGNLINLVDTPGSETASHAVLRSLERRSALSLHQTDVDEAIDRRVLLRAAYLMLGLVALFAVYLFASPKDPFPSLQRAMLPLSQAPVATRTLISDVTPGNATVSARKQVRVEADIRGAAVERVLLKLTTADRKLVDFPVEMTRIEAGQPRFRGVIEGEPGRGVLGDLEYQLEAGDAVSARYQLHVTQPPSARVETIDYLPPEYTGLPRETREGGVLEGLEGTRAILHAVASEPVESARLVVCDSDIPGSPGEEFPMTVSAGHRIEGDWTLRFRPDGTAPRFYRLEIRTPAGETDPAPAVHPISILIDQRPEVTLLDPTKDLVKPLDARVPLALLASDPDFLLRTLSLKLEKNGEPLPDEVLFPGKLPTRQLRAEHLLDLAPLNLRPGDRLQFWIEARDNRQPVANRGSTPKLLIEIAKPFDSDAAIEKDLQAARENQRQLPGDQAGQEEPRDLANNPAGENPTPPADNGDSPANPAGQPATGDRPNPVGREPEQGDVEPATPPTDPALSGTDENAEFQQQLERLLDKQRQSPTTTSPAKADATDPEAGEPTPREPLTEPSSEPAGEAGANRKNEPASQRKNSQGEPGSRSAAPAEPRDANRNRANPSEPSDPKAGNSPEGEPQSPSDEPNKKSQPGDDNTGPAQRPDRTGSRSQPSTSPDSKQPPQPNANSGEQQSSGPRKSSNAQQGTSSERPAKTATRKPGEDSAGQGSRSNGDDRERRMERNGEASDPQRSREPAETDTNAADDQRNAKQPAGRAGSESPASESAESATSKGPGEQREPGQSATSRDPQRGQTGNGNKQPRSQPTGSRPQPESPSAQDSTRPAAGSDMPEAGERPTRQTSPPAEADPKSGAQQSGAPTKTANPSKSPPKDPNSQPGSGRPNDSASEGEMPSGAPTEQPEAGDRSTPEGEDQPGTPAGDKRGKPSAGKRPQGNPSQPKSESDTPDEQGEDRGNSANDVPDGANPDEANASNGQRPDEIPAGQRPERPGTQKKPQPGGARPREAGDSEKPRGEEAGGQSGEAGDPADEGTPSDEPQAGSETPAGETAEKPQSNRPGQQPKTGRKPDPKMPGSEEPTLDTETTDEGGDRRTATKPGTNAPHSEDGEGGQPAQPRQQPSSNNKAQSPQGQPSQSGQKTSQASRNSQDSPSNSESAGQSDSPSKAGTSQPQQGSGSGKPANQGQSSTKQPAGGSAGKDSTGNESSGTESSGDPSEGDQPSSSDSRPGNATKGSKPSNPGGSSGNAPEPGQPGGQPGADETGTESGGDPNSPQGAPQGPTQGMGKRPTPASERAGTGREQGGPSSPGKEGGEQTAPGDSDKERGGASEKNPGQAPSESSRNQQSQPGGRKDSQGQAGQRGGEAGRDSRAGGSSQQGSAQSSGPGSGNGNRSVLPTDHGEGPDGNGAGAGDAGGPGELDPVEDASAPSADHLREASNLILKNLQGRLERGEVDDELLKEYGWKDLGALEKFVSRLEEQLESADDNSPEAQARQKEFDELLKSMALSGQTQKRGEGQGGVRRVDQVEARRRPVPSELRQRFDAFTRSLSQPRGPATKAPAGGPAGSETPASKTSPKK